MSKKILYRNGNNNEVNYARPRDSEELRILVKDGFCVCDYDEIDFAEYFLEYDWFFSIVLEDLKEMSYKDIPRLDIEECFSVWKNNLDAEVYYENEYNSILSCEDLREMFEMEISNITDHLVYEAELASEYELEHEII